MEILINIADFIEYLTFPEHSRLRYIIATMAEEEVIHYDMRKVNNHPFLVNLNRIAIGKVRIRMVMIELCDGM